MTKTTDTKEIPQCRYCGNGSTSCSSFQIALTCELSPKLSDIFPEQKEQVDHPQHYGGKDDPYEVIKVMEAWLDPNEFRGACLFNSHKYMARYKKKGGIQDLEKARWYLTYYLDYEKRTRIIGDIK